MKPRRASARMRAAYCILCTLSLACSAGFACGPPSRRGETDESFPAILERRDLKRLLEAGFDRQAEPLIEALADADAAVRATAAYALASVRDPAARSALTARLQDDEPLVRGEAAFALGQLRNPADASALLNAVASERDSTVRRLLLEAIGKSGDVTALSRLLAAAPSSGTDLAVSLFHFGRRGVTDTAAGAVLLEMVASADARAAATAALALATARDVERWGVTPGDVRHLIGSRTAHGPGLPALLGILAGQSDPADLPLLQRMLEDAEDWRVRNAAAGALGVHAASSGSSPVLDALLRALDDPSPHVAVTAANTLVRLSARSRAGTDRPSPGATGWSSPAALDAHVLAEWIVAHAPERASAAAALLPALIDSPNEALVLRWARGSLRTSVPPDYAFPAVAMMESAAADSVLLAALRGERRVSYAAAGALADRIEDMPAESSLRDAVMHATSAVLDQWGPHAPGSDLRGLLRLVQDATEHDGSAAQMLVRAARMHPAPTVRAAAGVTSAAAASSTTSAAADSTLLPRRAVDWDRLRAAGPHPRLMFETSRGTFEVELDATHAPLAVSSIMAWAEAGAYDALTFHRVEPDFILQSGDIPNALGYGGPDRGLRSEITHLPFAPGVFGVASAGADTEGSQYFITHSYAPSLDGRYSAVGRVVAGFDVAESVALGDSVIRVAPVGW